jgi:hypothetical protein
MEMSIGQALVRTRAVVPATRGRVPTVLAAGVTIPTLTAFSLFATSQIPLLLLSTLLLALCAIAGRDRMARSCAALAESRRIARREAARYASLGRSEIRRAEYRELREMVDRITALDPVLAAELELEDLLDRFVAITLAHARRAALALRPLPAQYFVGQGLAMKVGQQRLAYRAQCSRIADALDDELAAIRELVALTLERAATSDELDAQLESNQLESEVARRMWILTPSYADSFPDREDLDATG